jgi:hypothetical protein
MKKRKKRGTISCSSTKIIKETKNMKKMRRRKEALLMNRLSIWLPSRLLTS